MVTQQLWPTGFIKPTLKPVSLELGILRNN